MLKEKNYDFLKRMRQIHIPDRRDHSVTGSENDIVIDDSNQRKQIFNLTVMLNGKPADQ